VCVAACRSTAVEVALKMAFRTFAARRGQAPDGHAARPLHVLALQNGYHGDTLGAMDCAEQSVFNVGQTPWYQPRGLFLEPPTCGLERGAWQVRAPRDGDVSNMSRCCASSESVMSVVSEV
jgi:bifunctional dethiobiotin synthetase / adenosylmethionine---8-amino-7-oxononanoate aminotransferase